MIEKSWESMCCKAPPLEYFEWLMVDLASARCAKCKEGDVLFTPMYTGRGNSGQTHSPGFWYELKQQANPNERKEITEKDFDDIIMMDRHARSLAMILVEVEDTTPPQGLHDIRPRAMPREFEEAFSDFIHAFTVHFNINQKQFMRYIRGYTRNWEPRTGWMFYDDERGHDVFEQIRLSQKDTIVNQSD